ncbi:hypothetical protein TrRE_jg11954 [Triparma retinervis]|uniref:Uncharacterized protein n=1 Tax=Triparma retinervis TaxID=2557542 RepID=A0A9W6ZUF3_9STRA|nr:hypothetical protein TrRE_jg11954 [Triparma retinervis]
MGRKVDKAKRDAAAMVREVEGRLSDKVAEVEETLREVRRRNNKQSRVILELKEDKKGLALEVRKAQGSAEERAEALSSGLIGRMRESLLSHSKDSKARLDAALSDIRGTHVPLEEHRASMAKIRREYESAREGVVEVMGNKLRIGVEASEIKNQLLRGEMEKMRVEIEILRGGGGRDTPVEERWGRNERVEKMSPLSET